jgi:hypothetical protein
MESPEIDENTHSLHLINLSTQMRNSSDRVRFGAHSAPLDFDGARLLWLEFAPGNMETLMLFKFTDPDSPSPVLSYNTVDKHVSFAKLWFNTVIVVQGSRNIRQYDVNNGALMRQIGSHSADIIAFNLTTKTISQASI